MDIVILRGTVAAGKRRKPGEVLSVSEQEARLLINTKKAEESKPKPKGRKTKAIDSSELETRDAG